MKQLLAWTGSADSTITSEAVMAMAEKFNTGQEVCLQIPSARGVMQVKEGTSGSYALPVNGLKIETQRKRTFSAGSPASQSEVVRGQPSLCVATPRAATRPSGGGVTPA